MPQKLWGIPKKGIINWIYKNLAAKFLNFGFWRQIDRKTKIKNVNNEGAFTNDVTILLLGKGGMANFKSFLAIYEAIQHKSRYK